MPGKPGRPKKQTPDSSEVEVKTASMTSEEAAIFERVKGEDDEWLHVTEGDVEDFSLANYPFQLPPEAQKLLREKKFVFRYAEKTPSRIDELRNLQVPLRWWIANASTIPQLAKYCDPIHGGIQEHDQILMFKPYWMQDLVWKEKARLAELQDTGGVVDNLDGMKDDERGIEYRSGERYKITGKDEVMDPGSMLEKEYSQDDETPSDLGDLVVNE